MDQLLALLGIEVPWDNLSLVAGLIMVRLLTMITLVPFLFGEPVPNMIKMGVALVLLAFVYPAVAPTVPPSIFADGFYVISLFIKEFFYGLALGLAAGMIFYGFDAAGQVIDNQRGASMAQIFSPQTGAQITIFGQFTLLMAIVLFLTIGGHRLFLEAFLESYTLLPIYEMPAGGIGFLGFIDQFIVISGRVLLIAAQLSAPVLISIFLVDIVLGLINRISPAVNVLTLGFTIRGVVGVLIFFVSITVIAHQMELISMESIDNVKTTIRFLVKS